VEWRLLTSFQGMVEQMQQRMIQLKHAEQELREKEEQYRSSFEAPYDGINIIDSDGYFVEVNPAFCRMFGYTRDELIYQKILYLLHITCSQYSIQSLPEIRIIDHRSLSLSFINEECRNRPLPWILVLLCS
jgi:PAS domain-containing protein